MNEPWNKKKISNFNLSFDFMGLEKAMDELMGKMFMDMNSSETNSLEEKKKPMVLGFSFRMNENGHPVIERFGNVKPAKTSFEMQKVIEPLTDIIEEEKEIVITAELPGISKQEINLRAENEKTIILQVNNDERPYYKRIELKNKVKKDSAKASFKNGVIEARFEKVENKEKENDKNQIKIE